MTRHRVYVLPGALKEIDRLPGHIRQRVRRAVTGLRDNPQPPTGRQLDYEVKPGHELWRLRLDNWRIVYLIDREWNGVYVLAVRKRPPYQYQDLPDLLADAE